MTWPPGLQLVSVAEHLYVEKGTIANTITSAYSHVYMHVCCMSLAADRGICT